MHRQRLIPLFLAFLLAFAGIPAGFPAGTNRLGHPGSRFRRECQ